MTGAVPRTERRISRRDYFLLPLLSLFTMLLLFALAEIGARFMWPAQEADSCVVGNGVEGYRMLPDCTSRMKVPEGVWTVNRYNDCGYRSETSCGPKPPSSVRIVLLGSSVAQGTFIPYEQTFFVRAARQVEAACHRTIDIQDLGVPALSPIFVYRRLDAALALKPDVVLFVLTPFDLEQQIDPEELAQRNNPEVHPVKPAVELKLSPLKRLERVVLESRAVLIAQHYLFSDENTFLKLYLVYGDKADFLRTPLTAAWEKRFADMDVLIGDMAQRVHAAGAALIVMPVPSRAEAALLSTTRHRSNIDAAAFGRRLDAIAAKNGAGYIDLMSTFARIPKAENLFYVVDGHLTPKGQQVLSTPLAQKLLDANIPALAHCSEQKGKS